MSESRRISDWLLEESKRADIPGRLRKLVVCHIVKGNKIGDEIRAVTAPDAVDEDWSAATAKKIIEHASTEALALGSGVQRYVVQTLFEGDDKPHGRMVFAVSGPDELEREIDTESPDEQGLVVQSMGLTRFFAREHSRSSTYREKALVEENQQLRRENQELRAEQTKRFKLVEELQSQRHQRELDMLRETSSQQRADRALDKLELMVPWALNHMTGKKLLPETDPAAMMLRALAEKISPEQFAQVSVALGPELAATLWQLMQLAAKPKPEAAAASSAANGAPA